MLRILHFAPDTHTTQACTAASLPTALAEVRVGERYWIDLSEATEDEEAAIFSRFFPLHPLALEDITRIRRLPDQSAHLPKVEEFDGYLFVIVNPLPAAASDPSLTRQMPRRERWKRPQLSVCLAHRVIITHHYSPLSCVDTIWDYLRHRGELLHRGPDYIFHLILDAMVDEYAPVVERFASYLDRLEILLFESGSSNVVSKLLQMKRRILFLRKTLLLEREVLARLVRAEFQLVTTEEIHYYRNVYDHLVRYSELIEGAREMTSDLMQLQVAAASNKLNQIMKMLTMISTIILPMTLIAGVYGMNFEHMPELKWEYGYPMALGLMLLVAIIALTMFRWKRWL